MRIDHLVWYDADLARGRGHIARSLGIEPLYGGAHPGEGTANAVLGLGPSTYLEILGRDPAQAAEALDPEVARLSGSGLYHWAIGGLDLKVLRKRAAAAGLAGGALVPGGRVKPDGKRLDWACWGLRDHGFGALLPFFIDWRESEHPALSAPQGGQIAAFALRTPEPARLRRVIDSLGLDIAVVAAEQPAIFAVLEGSGGRTEISSFVPLPRGYVI